MSHINWILFNLFGKVKYISIVNLIADKKIIPELIQHEMTEKNIKIPNQIDIKKDQNDNYKENNMAKKSFPSNHAANICFISFFLSYMYYNRRKYFITLAILVSISRVYIGVHYPLDIMVGALIGITVGYLMIKIINNLGFNLARYHPEA